MNREWYFNKAKEINSIVKQLENRFEYHITNQGYWYHRNQKDPLEHTFYINGNTTRCGCGHTIEKRLRILEINNNSKQ